MRVQTSSIKKCAIPVGWRSAAVALGITLDEYAEKLDKDLRYCGYCKSWVDPVAADYLPKRHTCRACRNAWVSLPKAEKEAHKKVRAAERLIKRKARKHRLAIHILKELEVRPLYLQDLRQLTGTHSSTLKPILAKLLEDEKITRSGRYWNYVPPS